MASGIRQEFKMNRRIMQASVHEFRFSNNLPATLRGQVWQSLVLSVPFRSGCHGNEGGLTPTLNPS